MRSSERSPAIDLERDLPTTTEDVAALRRARTLVPLDMAGYLRFLAQLPQLPYAALAARRRRAPDVPFELPAEEPGSPRNS
jgi:hypothetical protein